MYAALNILNLPCFHSFRLYTSIPDCRLWSLALDAKYFPNNKTPSPPFTTSQQFDKLLAGYAAVTDVPATAFCLELITAYPDAKVILMERDVESWFHSYDNAVIKSMWAPTTQLIGDLDPWFVGPLKGVAMRWARGWIGVNSEMEMRSKARGHYLEHNAFVRKITPPERLLIYKMGSGWEPLCEFLGKPIPEVEFPRVNETAALKEKIAIIVRMGFLNLLKRVLLFGGPVVLALLFWAVKYH
ncbi:MAG: hypothetical protein Q9220_007096 [cf. Caloplaca sp. 1 TL-2023]